MTITTKTFPINSKVNIPAVGFGTYLISPEDTATAVFTAIKLGYRHIDTASVYQNEEAVGEGIKTALKELNLTRNDIFVTTKLWPGMAEWGEKPKSEEETIAECEASLSKLGLEYIDLYLIHSPHGGVERIPQWKALVKLKEMGKVHSIGVSNFNEKHLNEILISGLPMPEVNQIELHPWSQKFELLDYMKKHNIKPIAYSSLAPLSTWRVEKGQDSAKTEEMKASGNVFVDMAKKYNVTEAQFLLKWGIQNGYAVLPKSLNPERMLQNISLGEFEIDNDDMVLISKMDKGDGIAWSIGDPSQFN
jgi:2,5-diketo-D-gluconate reductase A